MKKRTNKRWSEGTVGYAVMALLEQYDFDTTEHRPRKKFYDGYDGALSVNITAYPEHAYVTFSGTGVKKEKCMDYGFDDLKKLEARIKRLLVTAERKADQVDAFNFAKKLKFELTESKLIANGITNAVQCEFSANAIFLVNGYNLQCGENLLVHAEVGGNRLSLDVTMAVSLMNSLPFNPNFDEEQED